MNDYSVIDYIYLFCLYHIFYHRMCQSLSMPNLFAYYKYLSTSDMFYSTCVYYKWKGRDAGVILNTWVYTKKEEFKNILI